MIFQFVFGDLRHAMICNAERRSCILPFYLKIFGGHTLHVKLLYGVFHQIYPLINTVSNFIITRTVWALGGLYIDYNHALIHNINIVRDVPTMSDDRSGPKKIRIVPRHPTTPNPYFYQLPRAQTALVGG